jgi:hypothetical protein
MDRDLPSHSSRLRDVIRTVHCKPYGGATNKRFTVLIEVLDTKSSLERIFVRSESDILTDVRGADEGVQRLFGCGVEDNVALGIDGDASPVQCVMIELKSRSSGLLPCPQTKVGDTFPS